MSINFLKICEWKMNWRVSWLKIEKSKTQSLAVLSHPSIIELVQSRVCKRLKEEDQWATKKATRLEKYLSFIQWPRAPQARYPLWLWTNESCVYSSAWKKMTSRDSTYWWFPGKSASIFVSTTIWTYFNSSASKRLVSSLIECVTSLLMTRLPKDKWHSIVTPTWVHKQFT